MANQPQRDFFERYPMTKDQRHVHSWAVTRFGGKDDDLHRVDGEHRLRPPTGLDPLDRADWERRMRQHLDRHELEARLPAVEPLVRPVRVAEGTDEWLAAAKVAVRERLGVAVRGLIEREMMTNGELAAEMGLSLSSMTDRLKGRADFTLAEALFIERRFRVRIERLLQLPS